MRQEHEAESVAAEQTVREIRRRTRRQFGAEDKIRIVIAGLRGDLRATLVPELPVYAFRSSG